MPPCFREKIGDMKKLLAFFLVFVATYYANAENSPQRITANPPLTLTNGLLSCPSAGSSSSGCLLMADWNTFNNKLGPSILTTKGDLLGFSTATGRFGVGASPNGYVLTVDSSAPFGFSWQAGGSGSIVWGDIGGTLANQTDLQNALNAKQNTLTPGNISSSTTGVTVTNGSSATVGPNTAIDIQSANGSQPGLLTAADWATFNGKQAAGNYVTSLTGEATGSGPGAASVTLTNSAVIGKVLTGFSASPGTVAATDTILQGFNKLAGNAASYGDVSSNTASSVDSEVALFSGAGGKTIKRATGTGVAHLASGVLSASNVALGSEVTGTLPANNGGTGVANNAASTLAISGNFGTTLTVTGTTGLTLPTTGTLATLAGSETLSNKTLTSPVLNSGTVGTQLTFGNYHIEPGETDAGNSGTADTIDWSLNSAQRSTLTGNVTYTFSNPVTGGSYVLRVLTGAGSFTATWPATVKWAGGTAPTITTTASRMDLVNFYYDGTNYYGSYTQNYTP